MKIEQWGFSYGKFRSFDSDDYYKTHYKTPSKLKKMRNYGNGVYGIYYDNPNRWDIKFIESSEKLAVKKCLKIVRNFAEQSEYDTRFLNEVKIAFISKYPELFI